MVIARTRAKIKKIMNDSHAMAVAITVERYIMLVPTAGVAAGNMTLSLPAGQGVNFAGVLQNPIDPNSSPARALAIGDQAEIMVYGIAEIRAAAALNAGAEVTINDASGRIGTAAAADYVCGTAREAAVLAGSCISVVLRKYQKNA
jgi:hypothetical protein